MKLFLSTLAITLALATPAPGQNETPKLDAEFYRFHFTLKELEKGREVNVRDFQMMARTQDKYVSSIRSGARVPVPGEKGATYIDVGVNIDIKNLVRTNDELTLEVIADVSGAIDPTGGKTSPASLPVVRQAKWSSIVLIPIRKGPTVIFSSDDPASKRQLQLEVTATPLQ